MADKSVWFVEDNFQTLMLILITRLFVHPDPHTYLTMTIDVISFW